MAFNVWFVIWPNQKRAIRAWLSVTPELKAKSALRTAMLSLLEPILLFSLPMLLCQW